MTAWRTILVALASLGVLVVFALATPATDRAGIVPDLALATTGVVGLVAGKAAVQHTASAMARTRLPSPATPTPTSTLPGVSP